MTTQAIRRSPRWFAARARMRALDVAALASFALGAATLAGWWFLAFVAPAVLS